MLPLTINVTRYVNIGHLKKEEGEIDATTRYKKI